MKKDKNSRPGRRTFFSPVGMLLGLLLVLAVSPFAFADGKPAVQSEETVEKAAPIYYTGDLHSAISIPAATEDGPVTKLADKGFFGSEVKSVYLEDGIEEIGEACFAESEIDYIHIPASVKTIGAEAFRDCRFLTSFALESDEIVWEKDALAGTGNLHIGVPCTLDLDKLSEALREAKGNETFTFDVMHVGIVESMVEKDIYGRALVICTACGYRSDNYAGGRKLPFKDVPVGTWYYPYVLTAWDFGILNGKTEDWFDPEANMTLAEAAKIAACVRQYLMDDVGELKAEGGKWYQPYVDYCYEHNIIDSHMVFDWEKTATRAEMAYLFSRADIGGYEPNPEVPLTDIPDVSPDDPFAWNILTLYRRGIAVGSNEYYAFYPDANVKRSEAAAFVARIICYDMRVGLPKG